MATTGGNRAQPVATKPEPSLLTLAMIRATITTASAIKYAILVLFFSIVSDLPPQVLVFSILCAQSYIVKFLSYDSIFLTNCELHFFFFDEKFLKIMGVLAEYFFPERLN